MAFKSGVFTSTSGTVNGDGIFVGNKAVDAAFLAKRQKHMFGNGISLNPTSAFYVAPVSGLTARVSAGWGTMEGYDFEETTDYDITMNSSTSDQTLYIGVRLDVATGEFTGNHVAARTTFIPATDRVFAIIVIPANAVTLTTAMITDVRYNTTYCGTVNDARVALAALATEYQEGLDAMNAGGIPAHATNHRVGGSDALALTDIATAGVSYADPTLVAMLNAGGVFAGGAVTAQGTPNQTVAVSAGSIVTPEGKRYAFNAVASLAASAADATNPRIDIVYVSSAGVVTYLAGTAAASPSQPATPSNGTILAKLTRAANDNAISTAEIEDQRDFITTANDFEDTNLVTESSNTFTCDIARKHTKNFYFTITNTTGKTVVFSNKPYGTCDVILTIKATATASVTWTLDGITLVWPAGAPTVTAGYTYDILFSYVPILGKWVGRAQRGAAN